MWPVRQVFDTVVRGNVLPEDNAPPILIEPNAHCLIIVYLVDIPFIYHYIPLIISQLVNFWLSRLT